MGTISNLVIKISGDISGLKSALSGAIDSVTNAGEQMQSVGAKMTTGITLPIVGIGVAALKAATDFNAGMANVASLGVPIERVNELQSAVQNMSIELGKSTGDLADGLYQVVSAFGDGADTVEILRINAQAAAAGLATTTDAINLTSSVTKAYGDTSASAIQQVSDLAFQAVKLGQTTFPELASSMGRVAPLAASLGVSVEELFGTMATFTGVTGTASEVSTQLRGVLQSLMAPTGDMEKLISNLGFASGEAMMQQLGLQGSIEAIVEAANATGTPLQKFIGSIEGQTLALAATGGQADVFTEKLAAMSDAMGASDAAFAAQTQGVNALGFQWSQLMARVSVFTQRLGEMLVPAALALFAAMEPLIDQAESLLGVFEKLDPATQAIGIGIAAMAALAGPALLALGTAMTMVAPAIGAVGTALGLLLSPVGLVIAAVVALGAAWTMNLGGIQEITASVVSSVSETWNRLSESTVSVTDVMGELVALFTGFGADWYDSTVAIYEFVEALTGSSDAAATVQDTLYAASESFAGFKESAITAFEALSTSAQTVMAQIGEIFGPTLERVQESFGGVGTSIGELTPHFTGLLEAVQGMVATILPIIQTLATALGVTLVVAASVGMNLVAAAIKNLSSIVGPVIEQITATIILISTTVSNVAKLIMATATGDWAGAWAAMNGIVDGFKTYLESTLENVKSFGIAIFDTLKTTVLATLGDLDSGAKSQMDALKSWWDSIWSSLTRVFEPVQTGIESVKSAIDGLKKGIEDFSGWITGISIPNPFAGIQMPSLPSLPNPFGGNQLGTSYAHGGWSWVGENRRPELLFLPRGAQVVPWQQSREMVGAGGSVNITIQNATVRSEQDLWELAYRIREIDRRKR